MRAPRQDLELTVCAHLQLTAFAADRYFWVKPPGESDGISDAKSGRYDSECGKPSAMRNAPNAGEWFHDQFVMLMQKSKPPLEEAPSYEPRVAPPQVATTASPPARPVGMSQEGDFGFSYDDAAETAPKEETTDEYSVKPGAVRFVW